MELKLVEFEGGLVREDKLEELKALMEQEHKDELAIIEDDMEMMETLRSGRL